MYTYPWYHWITFFYIYCFLGWIFESTYVSLKERRFVNRGFLRLPMLPLYGTGAVMMLWVSLPVQDSLILVYCFGVVAATALEYVTGYMMERLFKMKYWDYSYQRFQINGYICLSSSIAWGFLTIFLTKVIHRPIADFVLSLKPRLEFSLLAAVSAAFTVDAIQSTKEALALGRVLESMTKMKAELEEMQLQLALLRAEASQRLEDIKSDARQQMEDLQADALLRMDELKTDAQLRAGELKANAQLRMGELKTDAQLRVEELKADAQTKAAELKEETALLATELKESTLQKAARLKAGTHQRTSQLEKRSAALLSELKESAASQTKQFQEQAAALVFQASGLSQHQLTEKILLLTQHCQDLLEHRRRLSSQMSFYRRGLLKGNPSASSKKFAGALKELRDALDRK